MIHFLDIHAVTDSHAEEIEAAALKVVRSGWYLRGKATQEFEQAYATFIGTSHCVGCANGLDALALILKGYLQMKVMELGDEVIVPANTFIASVLSITNCGLKPVFVEPDEKTQQIDETLIEQAISPHTRAIMIVHLYGRCAYTEAIGKLCKQYNLKLIEDNAQAHGCRYMNESSPLHGKRTGSLGDAAGHSFYPGKNLGALGDAGAVTTTDKNLADTVRAIGNYGMEPKYFCHTQGVNSRIDEIQAAILSVKLKYIDEENERRRQIAEIYHRNLPKGICRMDSDGAKRQDNVFHIFPVFSKKRDEMQKFLAAKGIETQIHYPVPPHKQQCFPQFHHLSLPITERLAQTELSLPISPVITENEALFIAEAINDFQWND
ncbi:MAG: DegT/DnrJ/EryC1/StrS family aminotransferase [Bacteroidaceae bacterium]|nr:DegT/DnrJ/EryC1/StrS family aminotransferase [Bacteroidaceae bacterium]